MKFTHSTRAAIQSKGLEIEFEPLYFVLLFLAYVPLETVHQCLIIILL